MLESIWSKGNTHSSNAGGGINLYGYYRNQYGGSSGRWGPSVSRSSYTTLGDI